MEREGEMGAFEAVANGGVAVAVIVVVIGLRGDNARGKLSEEVSMTGERASKEILSIESLEGEKFAPRE